MKKFVSLLVVLALGGMTEQLARADADSTVEINNLFFGGTCSDGWDDAARNSGYETIDAFGFWAGEQTYDAYVTQLDNTADAVADLKWILDEYCTGEDSCYIFAYSQGGAIVSKVFNDYATTWNIYWVAVTGNNEGGSELSYADWVAELVLGCPYASHVSPGDNRAAGWNHNDTNGEEIRQFVGDIGAEHALWWATSAFLPGDDDGTVAFHSAAGATTVGSYTDACSVTRWTNHVIRGPCAGYTYDHLEIKTQGSCYYGGGNCP